MEEKEVNLEPEKEEEVVHDFDSSSRKTVYILFGLVFGAIALSAVVLVFNIANSRRIVAGSFHYIASLPAGQPALTPAVTLSPSPLPPTNTPVPTVDPGRNWNVYTNSIYGYTIKYPTDWTVQNRGALEPKVPSYIVFNPNDATASAKSISISVSTRTYQEELALSPKNTTTYTAAGINGVEVFDQDSDGNQSETVILPHNGVLFLLHAKILYTTVFSTMVNSFMISK